MKYSIISLFLLFISCANPKPRKPVSHTGRIDMTESIAFNKQLNKYELELLKDYMKKDSLHSYIDSHHGFWYTYLSKNNKDSITPVKGDEVEFSYDIKSLKGDIIYSNEELGNKIYLVDQQDFMQGIQEGIKLMKVDEKVLFLLPSIKAYGVYGDRKKIKENTPVAVTVELITIRK